MAEDTVKAVKEMASDGITDVDAAYLKGVADHIRFSRNPDELEDTNEASG